MTEVTRTRAVLLTKLMAIGPLDKVTVRLIVSGLLAPETQRRQPEIGADLAERLLAWDRRGFIAAVRSVLVDRGPVLHALPDVKAPALIVSGKEDRTLPSIHGGRIAEKLLNARHIEASGAAHLVRSPYVYVRGWFLAEVGILKGYIRDLTGARLMCMDIIDLTPNLRMLVLDNPGQAYLVRHGEHVILVDTGTAGQTDSIAEALESWGSSRDALTHVLLTHWHPDHVGSASALSEWPNVKIWAHKSDAPIIRGDQPGNFPVLTHTEEGFYAQVVGHVPNADSSRVDRELEDDETLDEISARVISTPGHTAGSIAFYFPDEKVLFTGDVATEQQGQVVLGPFDVDRDAARQSFRRLAGLDVDTVCFGHGQPLTGGDTKKLEDATHAETVPDPLG